MSMAPGNDESDADREAGKQANAMRDRLRKDVASWSATRSATRNSESVDQALPPPVAPVAVRSPSRAKRSRPVPQAAATPVGAAKKPFRMSYDGVTEADYISSIIERGV